MSCNLLILEEHLEVDTCQGSQRIKYEELILLNNIFHCAKNKIVQNYRSFSSWRYFFTYQSVTTSWEYVWLGTDLARAKPRNNQPRLEIDKQISLENERNAKWSYWWGGVGEIIAREGRVQRVMGAKWNNDVTNQNQPVLILPLHLLTGSEALSPYKHRGT